eukprot:GHVS01076024.1.p1 GENE.GHVS01076024.1~~GHVS01076024.1.p1  ORF type:complete len:991 (+),score=186.63 GHVS01076024.1:252-3224(+)
MWPLTNRYSPPPCRPYLAIWLTLWWCFSCCYVFLSHTAPHSQTTYYSSPTNPHLYNSRHTSSCDSSLFSVFVCYSFPALLFFHTNVILTAHAQQHLGETSDPTTLTNNDISSFPTITEPTAMMWGAASARHLSRQSSAGTVGDETRPSIRSCDATEVLFVSQFPPSLLSILGFPPEASPDITILTQKQEATTAAAITANLSSQTTHHKPRFSETEALPLQHIDEATPLNTAAPTLLTLRAVVLEGLSLPLWISHDLNLSPTSFSEELPTHITTLSTISHAAYRPQQLQLLRYFQQHAPPSTYRTAPGGFVVVNPAHTPASVFKVLAPVTGVRDMFAAMLLLPVIKVRVHAGTGLFVSYKVATTEGEKYEHKHEDEQHRIIADVDIQYRRCELPEDAPDAARDIPVTVDLTVSHCSPMSFTWLVRCAKTEFLQDVARGFHAGRLYTPTTPGDIVADGVTVPSWSDVSHAATLMTKEHAVTDVFVWCSGCAELSLTGGLETKFPTIASDMDVVGPEIHLSKPHGVSDDSAGFYFGSGEPTTDKFMKLYDGELWHFRITYDCHKEGRSIVVVEFKFHGFRNVQFAFKKDCAAPSSFDNSCAVGLLSADKAVCCPKSCGTCCGDLCSRRNGGPESCCCSSIIRGNRECHNNTPPCVMKATPTHSSSQSTFGGSSESMSAILSRTHLSSPFDVPLPPPGFFESHHPTSPPTAPASSSSAAISSATAANSATAVNNSATAANSATATSSGTASRGVGVVSVMVRWLLRQVLLWSFVVCLVLIIVVIYDKYTRGHRGGDLIPGAPELLASFQLTASRAGRLISACSRNAKSLLSSSLSTFSYSKSFSNCPPRIPLQRLFSSSTRGGYQSVGHHSQQPAVNLSPFDLEEEEEVDDELTGTTSMPSLPSLPAVRIASFASSQTTSAGSSSASWGMLGGDFKQQQATATTGAEGWPPVVIGEGVGDSGWPNISGGSSSNGGDGSSQLQQQRTAEFPYGSI